MSSRFLQRLRREQSLDRSEQSQCLFYRLKFEQAHLSLSLVVARTQSGATLEAAQPYRLQPAHLAQPPRFLDATDLHLLRQLGQTEPAWMHASEGKLPELTPLAWLQAAVATGRAHLIDGGGIDWGESLTIACGWEIGAEGEQQLDWRPPPGVRILPTHPPTYWDEKNGRLGPLAMEIDLHGLAWLRRRPRLTPEEVEGFIDTQGAHFSEWKLPRPHRIPIHTAQSAPRPRLRLYRENATDRLRLQFHYDGDDLPMLFDAAEVTDDYRRYDSAGQRVIRLCRDREAEAKLRRTLEAALAECAPRTLADGGWSLKGVARWRPLMTRIIPALERNGWRVTVAPDFRHHYVKADRICLDAAYLDRDWFDLALNVEINGETIPLLPLLADCARRYTQAQLQAFDAGAELPLALPDGRRLLLPAARLARWLSVLVELRDSGAGGESLRLPRAQLERLQALDDGELARAEDAEALFERARQLRSPPALEQFQLPADFKAELRGYQRFGVAWLQQRRRLGIGGILADDMGLGKTIQTLAHLCVERDRERPRAPALVVAPTSVLHNWRQEAARFAPGLRCTLLHGPGRHRHWRRLAGEHLLLTSYALVANDIEHWRQQELSAVILDEAQTIKNPRARVSRYVRELSAPYKICLTGTPLENHFGELWSLFDFLMPGLLDDENRFQRYYRKPIEKDGDQSRAQALLERIAPYILRRTKEEVARDLPPKTEVVVRLPLHDDQRDLYETLRQQSVEQLQPRLKESADGQGRVLILNALMQLRQVCCDPALVDTQTYRRATSAKREHLLEMLTELVEEGRAVLVFSQFTRMLALIGADLDARGIACLTLTGQSRERERLVEQFQSGRAPVFLISLKAGGIGLNLTRADTVIHYDPWWNSAAESQATDRAYRIGQDRPVFVYKLLAEETVEEKIHALQQHKRNLLDQVYRAAESHTDRLALDNAGLLALLER